MMNSPASLLSHLVADYGTPPAFVDRTYGEPLFHTDGEVLALRYAPDDTLWTVEETGVLRHWAPEGRLLGREFLSDVEDVWVFNADATLLASGTNEVALWETATGTELGRTGVDSWVSAFAFSPDGRTLASGHDDGRVCFWRLPDLELVAELAGHEASVSALTFSADGQQLTSAGDDHKIRVWDVRSRDLAREWQGHTDRVPALAWRPKGDFLISVGWDTTARVWEPGKDDPLMLLNAHADQVTAVAFSPDGGLLACADSDFTIHIWEDPRGAKQKFVLSGHTDEIRALAFNPSGTRLASAGADRVVHIWDVTTGKLVAGPNPSARHSIAVSGPTLFSTAGNLLQAWARDTGERVWPATDSEPVHFVAASPDGKRIATSGPTPEVKVWDLASRTVETVLPHTRGPIGSPTFSADGRLVATASLSDGLLWLWQIGAPEAILVIPEAADTCTLEAVAFHPSGKYVAVGGLDWLATSGADGALCVWDLEGRDKLLTLEAGVTALGFDANGRYLAAGTFSQAGGQSVVVWDFEKQEQVFDLPGHHDRINAVAFSPDGSWLVSGSDDCTVRVWNVLTGRLAVARQFDAAVQSLAFSPDGKYLLTGNGNTTAYRLEMKKMLED
jgi:WD40 repeat protein